jgi:hypothetical protein
MFEIVCGRAMMCSISIDTQSGNIAMSANSFDWVYAGIKRPHRRRLSDKIISAFHAACDEGALDIATGLLSVLQVLVREKRGRQAKFAMKTKIAVAPSRAVHIG